MVFAKRQLVSAIVIACAFSPLAAARPQPLKGLVARQNVVTSTVTEFATTTVTSTDSTCPIGTCKLHLLNFTFGRCSYD